MEQALKILITVVGISLWIGVIIIISFLLSGFLRLRNTRQHTLQLTNQGNVPVPYQLLIETAVPGLRFMLRRGKQPLEEIPVSTVDSLSLQYPAPVGPAIRDEDVMPVKKPSTPAKPGKVMAGINRSISNGLGFLGRVLPGEAGRFLREQQVALSRTQSVVKQGKQIQSKVRYGLGQLPGDSPRDKGRREIKSPLQSEPPPSIMRAVYQAKTSLVQPGEGLTLTLHVTSTNSRLPNERSPYVIHSFALPPDDLKLSPPTLSTSAEVDFPNLGFWRYFLLYGISLFAALFSLTLVVVFLAWIW